MSAPDAQGSNPAPTWPERNYRALKIAVVGMGILIVLGFVLVLVTIVNRLSADAPAETPPQAVVLPADVAALLGPEAEVVSTAIDGSRLVLVLRRPEGHSVLVVDLRSGEVLNVIGGR